MICVDVKTSGQTLIKCFPLAFFNATNCIALYWDFYVTVQEEVVYKVKLKSWDT